MPDKFSAEDVETLINNKYFQDALRRQLLHAPYTLVTSIGAVIGLGCLVGTVLWLDMKVTSLGDTIKKNQQQITQLQTDAQTLTKNLKTLTSISPRPATGTVMITSAPEGAVITVNEKARAWTTPARIDLPAGTYNLMVEKDGRRAVDRIVIRSGNTNFIKMSLR